jgi:putative colanic acid biosynthesis UDP-glucose lipid carrier transferase
MNTLARDFRSVGTELPSVAFARIALAPAVCVGCLGLCLVLYTDYEEAVTPHYAVLAIAAFFVSARIFGELPFTIRAGPLSLIPGRAILTNWLIVLGILLFGAFAIKLSGLYSRKVVLTWFVITPFALQLAQVGACRLLQRFVSANALVRGRIIVGVSEAGRELADEIAADPCLGGLKGFFDDRTADRLGGVKPGEILGGLASIADYVKHNSINVVYITLPMSQHPRVVELLDGLRDTTASIYFVPSRLPFDFIQARIDRIGATPVIAVCETPFYGIKGVLKRAFDLAVAGLVLLLMWPAMLAIAIGIKATSPGPVLFKQRRYGLDGKEITVYKFRTMAVADDDDCVPQATKNDPRVTRLGSLLRRTSLDELPQLINVLAGTMSIVGPRPHAVVHNEQYRRLINGYMLRYKVKPGITGWAQINGFRGETETVEKMQMRIEHDLDYLRHWSLSLDLWIVLRTAFVVVRDSHAY